MSQKSEKTIVCDSKRNDLEKVHSTKVVLVHSNGIYVTYGVFMVVILACTRLPTRARQVTDA